MSDELTYMGKIYRRVKGKWVDGRTYFTVSHLQSTLDKIWFRQFQEGERSIEELVSEADLLKEAGSIDLAIKLYRIALEKGPANPRSILPRLTSCFRKRGQPQEVIDLYDYIKAHYEECFISAPLCTSVAAAYCDLHDYGSAKHMADKAYALSKGKADDELALVYRRIRKETASSSSST